MSNRTLDQCRADRTAIARACGAHDKDSRADGQARADRLGSYAELGLDRLIMFPSRWDMSDEELASLAADVHAAGLPLAGVAREQEPGVALGWRRRYWPRRVAPAAGRRGVHQPAGSFINRPDRCRLTCGWRLIASG